MAINMYSQAAEDLLCGTAVIESGLYYLAQTPDPIALSLWQIEAPTYQYLRFRVIGLYNIKSAVLSYLNMPTLPEKYDYLAGNLYAACIFARLKYYFDPNPIPKTLVGQSAYWSKIYNTKNLTADQTRYVELYQQAYN